LDEPDRYGLLAFAQERRGVRRGAGRLRKGRRGRLYATPETRAAQAVLSRRDGGAVFFSGEALCRGRHIGTVEAALASGPGDGAD